MSGSETATLPSVAPGRIELHSPIRSLQLTIVATDFRPVATGFGSLSAELPPGFYEIRMRAGPIVERRLVRVSSGETLRLADLQVSFPSAAPVAGTSTTHEPHMWLAEEASRALRGSPTRTGLVLMVRDVRGPGGPPLDPADLQSLRLLDSRLQPLPGTAQGWRVERSLAAATWVGTLPPGGYALRAGAQPVDQSLWLAEGWQTIVFVTTGEAGLRVEAASVHMTQLDMAWMPQEREVGLALELALWGLREGRAVVPDDLMSLLLGSKFVNPMLGIVGAHALALRADLGPDGLDIVIANLQWLVPGHPDVAALRHLAGARRATAGAAGGTVAAPAPASAIPPVTWPPMLLESYRALIRSDARDPGAITDGSVAQEAAAHLQIRDVWTSWRPFDPARTLRPYGMQAPAAAAEVRAAAIAGIAQDPGSLRRVQPVDAADARVLRYLASVAEFEGPGASDRFLSMSPAEIGLATTLPAATVDRALARIGFALPPPPGPGAPPGPTPTPRPDPGPLPKPGPNGGGGGWLRLPVLLVMVAGLLLAGVGGAVALVLLDGRNGQADETPPPASMEVTDPPLDDTSPPFTPPPPPTSTPPTTFTPPPPTDLPSTPPPTEVLPPTVQILPELLFEDTELGSITDSEVAVANAGPGPLTFTALALEGDAPDDFRVSEGSCQTTQLLELDSCTLIVTFEPTMVGERTATMRLDTVEAGPFTVSLFGLGVEAPVLLRFEPSAMSFGSIPIGSQSDSVEIAVSQDAGPPVAITDWSGTGEEFPFEPGDCPGLVLEVGASCSMKAAFVPLGIGERSTVLRLFTSDGGIHEIPLSGFGLEAPTPTPGPGVD